MRKALIFSHFKEMKQAREFYYLPQVKVSQHRGCSGQRILCHGGGEAACALEDAGAA